MFSRTGLCPGLVRVAVAGVVTAWSVGAAAQTAIESSQQQERATLEEVTVTATRRAERLSKVPISVSAMTGEGLEKSAVKGIEEIAALTPGIQFDSNTANGPGVSTNIAIRGISSINGASTTGIYYEDTPLQARTLIQSAAGNPFPISFDLNRVEVLRGPQGTLFGAGAQGGAVRFIPNAPSLDAYSGYVGSEFASTHDADPSYEVSGAFGGPISQDKIGFRAGGYYRRAGGFIDHVDPLTGNTIEDNANHADSYAGRYAMTFKAGEAVTITPQIYYQKFRLNDASVYTSYRSDPSRDEFNNARLLKQPSTDKMTIGTLKVEADLAFADLTSVSSYFNRKLMTELDFTNAMGLYEYAYTDGAPGYGNPLGPEYPNSPGDGSTFLIPGKLDLYSQEIRLASKNAEARFKWQTGVFWSYLKQEDRFSGLSRVVFDSLANVYGVVQSPEQAAVAARFSAQYGYPADELFLAQGQINTERQIAFFGQVDYAILDRLTLSLGARVTRSTFTFKQFNGGMGFFGDPSIPGTAGAQREETPVTPKAVLSFQADSNNLFYVSAAKGYRGPQGNTTKPDFCNFDEPLTVKSDYLWSYEIGSKNRLFDGRLQLDASAYQIDWKDIQTLVNLSCGFSPVLNAGTARSRGFDLAIRSQFTDHLNVSAAVGYMEATYKDDIFVDGGLIVTKDDVVGSAGSAAQVLAPWSVTLAPEYAFTLSSGVDMFVRAEGIFRSKNPGPFAIQNPQSVSYLTTARTDPYNKLVNVRAGASWDQYSISLFVNNVANSQPELGRSVDGEGSSILLGRTFRPRTLGIAGNIKF
ncbi:MAG: TonB-dependent receptor [Pseudomonadota bacterium]|nr:TonB-dependent receptor [Pseudomonadota bacterium]